MTIDLETAGRDFAQQVEDLLDGVLRRGDKDDAGQPRIRTLKQGTRYVIRSGPEDKFGAMPLYANGKHVGDLEVSYYCAIDSAGQYLAVRKSSFQLSSPQEGTPLLRLDYDQAAHSVPAVHWNVHAERGATSVMLARCNPKHAGLVSQVHLPVGGVRGRPCLEDFLELLICEFNIDRHDPWRTLIKEGRRDWRVRQTRVLVRDSPEQAADVLRRLGYTVTPPEAGAPAPNVEMLHCR